MNPHYLPGRSFRTVILLLLASTINYQSSTLAQGTGFTYQGQLDTNSVPYSGSAEFQFTLWDAASGGNSVATNNPASVIATVANGLFTVTLDFGLNPFNGQPRFLQTDVRTAIGPFTTLTPRQPLTATPYALRALNLTTNGLAGTYGNAVTFDNAGNSFSGGFTGAFTGTASGDGSGLINVNATTLGGLSSANFWKTNGNAGANPTNGAFLGTTDNLPLELKVNGQRAFRLEPSANSSPNVIGGSPVNFVAAGIVGATISGGGATSIFTFGDVNSNSVFSDFGVISGGLHNTIRSNQIYSIIGGGFGNEIGGVPGIGTVFGAPGFNFIGSGNQNFVYPQAVSCAILGGSANTVLTNASASTIAGGSGNSIAVNASHSTIGGGNNNAIAANAISATIPGGENNSATNYAFAAGRRAKASHPGAFVWADSQNADFSSTTSNQFLIRASGGVGINTTNPALRLTVSGSGAFSSSSAAAILLNNTAANGHNWEWHALDDGRMQLADFSQSVSRMVIDTNGNVGIGIANPTNKLHVAGGVSATVFITTSDRNAKENFEQVSSTEVLDKVAALPITRWTFKEMPGQKHLGPMAQDFHAAFGLGADDRGIATVDEGGVALAAIQGLNQKLKETRAENAELRQRLAALENIIHTQKSN